MSGQWPIPINQLNTVEGPLVDGDAIAVYKLSQGTTVREPLEDVKTYMQDGLNFEANQFSTAYTIQNETPLTGGIIVVDAGIEGTENVYVVAEPAGTLPELTLQLPSNVNAIDGQSIVMVSSKAVTDFNVLGNGAAVVGRFTDDPFLITAILTFQYNKASNTWFRIG